MQSNLLHEAIALIDSSSLITIVKNGIEVEKVNLEAQKPLGNEKDLVRIKNSIADAKLFVRILGGDLRS